MLSIAYQPGGQTLLHSGQSESSFPEVPQRSHYPPLHWPVLALAKEFPARTRTGQHSHDRAQLLLAVEGLMVAHTPAGTWVVPRGYALWIPANLKHDFSMHGHVAMRTAYVSGEEAARRSSACRVLPVSPLLVAALTELAQMLSGEPEGERMDRLTWLVLDEIDRAGCATFVLPVPQDARLAKVARALIAHPGSTKTIDQWCDFAGLSRRSLTRNFRSETGSSFGAWRRRLRLLSAAARLADGEPIAKVASSLGYGNVAAFRAMARRQFGENFPDLIAGPASSSP